MDQIHEIINKMLIGRSEAMQEIKEKIIMLSPTAEPIFLEGETGTGKSLIANVIHSISQRAGNRFVTVSLPNMPDTLFESELFGYKKGAFTGADENRAGLFECANNGTLYFDEITSVPISMQAKLLRAIESYKIRRVGDNKEILMNIKIVSSTNELVTKSLEAGSLRKDLYFRIAVTQIRLPSLAQRREDIPTLIDHYRDVLFEKKLSNSSLEFLCREYSFPGNVRELLNILKRAGIESKDKIISLNEIMNNVIINVPLSGENNREEKVRKIISGSINGDNFWLNIWQRFINRDINRSQMKEYLRFFYAKGGGNLKKMAKELNVRMSEYPRLVTCLHKYKIHPKDRYNK